MNIETLRSRVQGALITAGQPDFNQIHDALIWNGRKPTRQAQIIVRAVSTADVREAVRYAAANGLTVSTRSGGHHFSGVAMQGDVIVDVSDLDGLRIDVDGRSALVGPGVTNQRLAQALDRHGLAFPVGHCGGVRVGGYLLGGGVGWNSARWGIACFSVVAAEVVTPDGNLVQTNADQNADLFWALRGGGPGFFGIITAFCLQLQAAPKAILTSVRVYPAGKLLDVASWVERAMDEAPATAELTVRVSRAPRGGDGADCTLEAITTVFANSEMEAAALLHDIGRSAPSGTVAGVECLPTPFDALFGLVARSMPEGRRYVTDSLWSDSSFADVLARVANTVAHSPSPENHALVMRRSAEAVGLGEGSFSTIGRTFGSVYGIWQDATADEDNHSWLRIGMADIAPLCSGRYVGEADLEITGHPLGIHSPAAVARLEEVRRRFDREGVFAHARQNA